MYYVVIRNQDLKLTFRVWIMLNVFFIVNIIAFDNIIASQRKENVFFFELIYDIFLIIYRVFANQLLEIFHYYGFRKQKIVYNVAYLLLIIYQLEFNGQRKIINQFAKKNSYIVL